MVPLVHRNGLPLDLVLSGPGLEERFLARVQRVAVGGLRLPVISPEDLIVVKLLAQRPQDLEDVRGIVTQRGDSLDKKAVRDLLKELEAALDRRHLTALFEELS